MVSNLMPSFPLLEMINPEKTNPDKGKGGEAVAEKTGVIDMFNINTNQSGLGM